jgi:hypothetical protein
MDIRWTPDGSRCPICGGQGRRFGGVVVQPLEAWTVLDQAERL